MHAATQAIQTFNHGRDPERLTRKLAAIAGDPFAFFRGTNHLYIESLRNEATLFDAPTTDPVGGMVPAAAQMRPRCGMRHGDQHLAQRRKPLQRARSTRSVVGCRLFTR